jgi:hypothetical protein
MTIEAYFQRNLPGRTAEAATLGNFGTAGLSELSAFVTPSVAPGERRELTGIALHEIHPAALCRQRDNQHA